MYCKFTVKRIGSPGFTSNFTCAATVSSLVPCTWVLGRSVRALCAHSQSVTLSQQSGQASCHSECSSPRHWRVICVWDLKVRSCNSANLQQRLALCEACPTHIKSKACHASHQRVQAQRISDLGRRCTAGEHSRCHARSLR